MKQSYPRQVKVLKDRIAALERALNRTLEIISDGRDAGAVPDNLWEEAQAIDSLLAEPVQVSS